MDVSTIPRLPIRPRPNPREESLTNYCLRVSEVNGYRTPTQMLAIAGIHGVKNLSVSAGDKIAPLLDVDPAVLREMAYVHPAGRQKAQWQRGQQRYRPHDVTTHFTRICPDCIEELGYARTVWDVRLVVACPKHNTQLLDVCSACSKPLTWLRSGLLTCACGNRLDKEPRIAASEWTVRVASLIEHAVYEGQHVSGDLTWFPQEVRDLPVEELLYFLSYWVTLSARLELANADEAGKLWVSFDVAKLTPVLNTVGRAAAEWPLSHARMIARTFELHGHHESPVSPTEFRRILGNAWHWAQRNGAPAVLRNEIKTYLSGRTIYLTKHTVGYLHPRHLIPFTEPGRIKKGVGFAESAELLGIPESLVRKLANLGAITRLERTLLNGVSEFDIESVLAIKPLIDSTCDYRDAATRLALSNAQYSELVKQGLLEVAIGRKRSVWRTRFRIDDVTALNSQVADLSHRINDDLASGQRIRLKDFPLISYGDKKRKREFCPLVEAILNGKFPIAATPAGVRGIGDYLLDVSDLARAGFIIPRSWQLKFCRPALGAPRLGAGLR